MEGVLFLSLHIKEKGEIGKYEASMLTAMLLEKRS